MTASGRCFEPYLVYKPAVDCWHAEFSIRFGPRWTCRERWPGLPIGSVKAPILTDKCRRDCVTLTLVSSRASSADTDRVLTTAAGPLAGLRPPQSDKRSQGHLLVLGGSRSYPGAVLMTVLAALRSGAGLVTAFVPESLAPAFAARAPEAMWVGWPETPDGGLALEGRHLLRTRDWRANALVIGPGLGREAGDHSEKTHKQIQKLNI